MGSMISWVDIITPTTVPALLIVFGWSMGRPGWRRYRRSIPADAIDLMAKIRTFVPMRSGYLLVVEFVSADGRQRTANVSVIDGIGRSLSVGETHTITWSPSQPDVAYFGSQNTIKTQNGLGLAMAAMGGLVAAIGLAFLIYVIAVPPNRHSGLLPTQSPRPMSR